MQTACMRALHPPVGMNDAAFVAPAEALDLPLVTTDRAVARTHGLSAVVLAP